jgi:hypothetical protein
VSVTRRLAVITGFGPRTEGSVEGALAALKPAGWRVLRRPRLGAAHLDHVVFGPGGVFVLVVRSGGGRLRSEWADEARAQASMLARLTRREVTPVVVLVRAAEWKDARSFHGVEVVPLAGLARHLVAHGHVLCPAEIETLNEALRLALAA